MSSKEERQISISQLAREYITAPANILIGRLRIIRVPEPPPSLAWMSMQLKR